MLIDDLIAAAKREEFHRRTIYKRLEMNEFVSHDYAASRIGEMVHIAQALQCLKAQGVERLPGDCERPTPGSAQTDTQNAHKPKTPRRNGKNRQKRARGAA
tara:strand:- start:182 stop:484 length:303 start_codon:yes stop_codon:yes gene_type:complete